MADFGWMCTVCTYKHKVPSARCAMCNEIRGSTRQDIQDFLLGNSSEHQTAEDNTNGSSRDQDGKEYHAVSNESSSARRVQAEIQVVTTKSGHQLPVLPKKVTDAVEKKTTRPKSNLQTVIRKGVAKPPVNRTASRAYVPGPVPCDLSTMHTWVFPVDEKYPKRQYQLEMAETAISHNTLVSLPTGLGKTLVAAVVLYNFYRWFSKGKVIFLAPTLPLVNQQVSACYNIMGIPANDTAVLTGKIPADRRQRIWKERRVFFCTPQTVQKDLEHGRVDADMIVCVVLDEAHKATGDYAYVKIVEYLHQASSARFRVLGLSATPGSNIKAIQNVVDALLINRIEARTEEDPSVAQYIHQRESEIVIVPHASAVTAIDRLFSDIICPLLDRLRTLGVRIHGSATVTSYNLMRAGNDFAKRTGSKNHQGYLYAAQSLCQIRNDLHRQGIGAVRTKLHRMRCVPQRGMLAHIVKTDEFNRIWTEVAKASCDPDSKDTTVAQKLSCNPKLNKLVEILLEHFERKKACGHSSRAIVFSQFRDSVSEIVNVLKPSEPLLLPRHFVGQGKGTSGDGQLKGMRQAEQHEVIRQFREGVYNVLVCTCIGEEGLDIGEVDLIVNFDTLRSPIRTIQRIGRTGRKRDGRVVSLVAEGAEERTLNASKVSARTLVHALRNPASFKVHPSESLLPSLPKISEERMAISTSFRPSQVEGHDGPGKLTVPKPTNAAVAFKDWRLTASEEDHLGECLGRPGVEQIARLEAGIDMPLRRHFLSGLQLPSLFGHRMRHCSSPLAPTSLLSSFLASTETRSAEVRANASNRVRNDERFMPVFPLVRNEAEKAVGVASQPSSPAKPQVEKAVEHNSLNGATEAVQTHGRSCDEVETGGQRRQQATQFGTILSNPYAKRQPVPSEKGKLQDPARSVQSLHPLKENVGHANRTADKESDTCLDSDENLIKDPPDGHKLDGDFESTFAKEHKAVIAGRGGDFELPTQSDSSSEASPLVPGETEQDFCLPSQSSTSSSETEPEPESRQMDSLPIPSSITVDMTAKQRRDIAVEILAGNETRAEATPTNAIRPETMTSQPTGRVTINAPPETTATPASCRINYKKRSLELSAQSTESSFAPQILHDTKAIDLSNTQEMMSPPLSISTQDVVCAICGSGESPEEDPIIFCDGRFGDSVCNLSVHTTCYSVSVDITSNEDWRCEPCEALHRKTLTRPPSCASCGKQGGAMKFYSSIHWKHIKCGNSLQGNQPNEKKRKRQTASERLPMNMEDGEKRKAKERSKIRAFFHEEAGIASDEDVDGDEDENSNIDAIEDEEADLSNFINDTSQLGFSQDHLGRIEGEDCHLAVDHMKAKAEQFATPMLNRQMKRPESPSPAQPDSARGLGKMHFIRSVLEHHKQGGRAEEIEQLYHELEQESPPPTEEDLRPQRELPERKEVMYESSDSE